MLVFRVPNEQPHANVVGLRVLIPTDHPIAQLSPESTPGWTVTTKSKLLAHPVKTDDGTFTTAVSEIDWTGGSIPPGQFGQFSVLAQGLPDDIGQLAFNTLQVYSNGQTVAWIEQASKGNPDPQHPAPILTLTATGSAPAGSSADHHIHPGGRRRHHDGILGRRHELAGGGGAHRGRVRRRSCSWSCG